MKLYDFPTSGNCWKVRLMLHFLGLEADIVPVDLLQGAHRTADYLTLNPLAQVPVLTDGEQVLRDSHAIIFYLANRYDETRLWYPDEVETQGQIVSWLSFSANELANGPSALRLIKVFGATLDPIHAREVAQKACAFVETKLADRLWLAGGEHPSIADVACYPYLALAHQGELELEPYPRLRAWLARLAEHPRYLPMEAQNAPSLR